MQPRDIEELPKTDIELLNSVLRKSPSSLTTDDIAVLNSRRLYLTYPQRMAYKGIIIDDIEDAKGVDPENLPSAKTQWSEGEPEGNNQAEDLAKLGEETKKAEAENETTEALTPPKNPYDVDPATLT